MTGKISNLTPPVQGSLLIKFNRPSLSGGACRKNKGGEKKKSSPYENWGGERRQRGVKPKGRTVCGWILYEKQTKLKLMLASKKGEERRNDKTARQRAHGVPIERFWNCWRWKTVTRRHNFGKGKRKTNQRLQKPRKKTKGIGY